MKVLNYILKILNIDFWPCPFKTKQFEDVMKKAVTFYGHIKLKKEQLEVLEAVYEGRDCVAVLPTGFGKSVIYHLIPYLTPQPTSSYNSLDGGSTAVSE